MTLTNPKVLYFKAAPFLVTGCLAGGLILLERSTLRMAALLAITVWSFARLYYFAFYVVEHYIDPQCRFAGLGSFARYLLRRHRARQHHP